MAGTDALLVHNFSCTPHEAQYEERDPALPFFGNQGQVKGGEMMRMESMKITRNAILSRNLAVVVDHALVLCLPGKPSGAVECLSFVVGAIPHCVEVLQEVPTSC